MFFIVSMILTLIPGAAWGETVERAEAVTVKLKVEGIRGTILEATDVKVEATAGVLTGLDVLVQGLTAAGITYEIEHYAWGPYVKSIANETAGTFGGWDGWMYEVTRGGSVITPSVGAGEFVVEQGDEVLFYYCRWPVIATASVIVAGSENPQVELELVGDEFVEGAADPANWEIDPGATGLTVAGIDQIEGQSQKVIISFAGTAQAGTVTIQAKAAALGGASGSNRVEVVVGEGPGSTYPGEDPRGGQTNPETSELLAVIEKTVGWYRTNYPAPDSRQGLVALWGAGEDLNSSPWRATQNWREDDPGFSSATVGSEHIDYIFRLLAVGKDPSRAWGGRNLFAELAAQQDGSSGSFGSLGKHIWALVALEVGKNLGLEVGSWDAESRQKAINHLLSQQNDDGSFGPFSQLDYTGWALIALSYYQGIPNVDQAIYKAVSFLKSKQQENAGFALPSDPWGAENANSNAAVISGLVAAGENLLEPGDGWVKNGHTVLDALLKFQQESGEFWWQKDTPGGVELATADALLALVDLCHGESTWHRMGREVQLTPELEFVAYEPAPSPPPGSAPGSGESSPSLGTIEVYIEIVGKNATHFAGRVSLPADRANAFEALKATGVPYKVRGKYVSEIAGEGEDLETTAGWKYKVNGVIPNVAAEDYRVKAGDYILWWYAEDYLSTGPGDPPAAKAPEKKSGSGATAEAALKLKEEVSRAVSYYRQKKNVLDSWWELLALWGAGEELHRDPWKLPEWSSFDLPKDAASVAYAGFILGMLAGGKNPAGTWEGRNLLLELAEKQQDNGGFGGTVNNTIWAVIALEAAGGYYDGEKAVKYLLSQQKKDGGFALGGMWGDPDVTGMALMALSFHRDKTEVEEAIKKALDYLKGVQLETGGFASFGVENSNSIATVISGLVAVGEDILAGDWVKSGKTMLDALLRFQLEDGSFSYLFSPQKYDQMATYQALIALGDALKGESVWQRMKKAELSFGSGEDVPSGPVQFSDVPEDHWAFQEIACLAARGIVCGTGGGKFEPEREITRSEFAALLVKGLALEMEEGKEKIFTDVPPEAWHAGYIRTAYRAGIVQGTGNGLFAPGEKITREQMAVMLVKAAGEKLLQPPQGDLLFKDAPAISDWALEGVKSAAAHGLLQGFPDGCFKPKVWTNRAQSAVVIYRLLTTLPN